MKPEDKAVVQQALDALEDATQTTAYDHGCEYHYHTCCGAMFGNAHMSDCKQSKAIAALRQLLDAEPVQEPVAWMNPHGGFLSATYIEKFASGFDKETHNIPLYTTPPAQPAAWVGLTDAELYEIGGFKSTHGYVPTLFKRMMKEFEAKLREKNGGGAQPADHTEQHLDMVRALDALLVVQDEPCVIDHKGYCQSHYVDNVNSHGGCRVANARALVEKVKGGTP
jgi:hypothetical protein